MAKKSLAALKAELAAMEKQIAEAEERAALKVGKLAAAEGLLDLDLSDAEWRKLFRELAARFQDRTGAHQVEEPARKAPGQAA